MFAYLFAKRDQANIDDDELLAFLKLAELYRRKAKADLEAEIGTGALLETRNAVHSAVEGMYAAGTIDKETMKTFDEACLFVPKELTPSEIGRCARTITSASQSSHAI